MESVFGGRERRELWRLPTRRWLWHGPLAVFGLGVGQACGGSSWGASSLFFLLSLFSFFFLFQRTGTRPALITVSLTLFWAGK
jgi:hypothetical protein